MRTGLAGSDGDTMITAMLVKGFGCTCGRTDTMIVPDLIKDVPFVELEVFLRDLFPQLTAASDCRGSIGSRVMFVMTLNHFVQIFYFVCENGFEVDI